MFFSLSQTHTLKRKFCLFVLTISLLYLCFFPFPACSYKHLEVDDKTCYKLMMLPKIFTSMCNLAEYSHLISSTVCNLDR